MLWRTLNNDDELIAEIELQPESEQKKLLKKLSKKIRNRKSPQEKFNRAMLSPRYLGISLNSYNFSKLSLFLGSHPAIHQKFLAASIPIQSSLTHLLSYHYDTDNFRDYCSILFNSGLGKSLIVNRLGQTSEKIPKRLSSSKMVREASVEFKKSLFEFAEFLDPFSTNTRSLESPGLLDYDRVCFISSSLYILKLAHSEEVVLEVIQKVLKEKSNPSIIQISTLVENWSETKDYSTDWSLAYLDSQSDE